MKPRGAVVDAQLPLVDDGVEDLLREAVGDDLRAQTHGDTPLDAEVVAVHDEVDIEVSGVCGLEHEARELVDRDAQVLELIHVEAKFACDARSSEADDPYVLE